jgi:hypothetical protein
VYCVWLVFEGVFLYFCALPFPFPKPYPYLTLLPSVVIETKNRTLEETAAIFDGEDATDQIVHSAAVQAGVTHDIGDEKVMDEKASSSS